jgi:hypothetical protein
MLLGFLAAALPQVDKHSVGINIGIAAILLLNSCFRAYTEWKQESRKLSIGYALSAVAFWVALMLSIDLLQTLCTPGAVPHPLYAKLAFNAALMCIYTLWACDAFRSHNIFGIVIWTVFLVFELVCLFETISLLHKS